VLLDEIGDMPADMQAKLLRVLQEREVRPVGGSKNIPIDVRVLAATHRDLEAAVRDGGFREDLFYRLNVVTLELPPLRERSDDLPALADYLLRRAAHEAGCSSVPELSPEALEVMRAYDWPGNVRELENELRRAVALGGDPIGPEDLSPGLRG
jgi:transcriptional regulator with GAF, ATPase, and Fis domain